MIPLQAPVVAVNKDTGSWLRCWLLEILALVLLVILMVTLIVLLKSTDRRGLKDTDPPGSLTLNGLVALISELARIALMIPVGVRSQPGGLVMVIEGQDSINI